VVVVKIELHGKTVFLLNGARTAKKTGTRVAIESEDRLLDAARQNPDAVAFGYMSGRWVAAA
jgi:hypothetical protein